MEKPLPPPCRAWLQRRRLSSRESSLEEQYTGSPVGEITVIKEIPLSVTGSARAASSASLTQKSRVVSGRLLRA